MAFLLLVHVLVHVWPDNRHRNIPLLRWCMLRLIGI